MIKAVIFDLDGTLTDTLESMAVAGNKTLKSVGLEPRSIEEYKSFAGDGADTLVQRMLIAAGDTKLEKFDEAYNNYMREFALDCTHNVAIYEGINELLLELKKRGIKMAVLSNKPHQRALQVVYKFFGESMFNIVFGHMDGVDKKPDPSLAIKISKMLGVGQNEVMYIGDTDVDMMTGVNAKMKTVGVLWGFREKEELIEYGAEYIVSRPEEILEIL